MGRLSRLTIAFLTIALTASPIQAAAQTTVALPAAAPAPTAAATPAAAQTPSIDHVFYGRLPHAAPASSPVAATAPTPGAPAASPVAAAATRVATPTALAAIIPPAPPAAAAAPAIPAPTSAATPVGAGIAGHPPELPADGLHLYLNDPVSVRLDPFNWSVTAIKSHHQIAVFYRGHLYQNYHAVFGRSRFAGPKQFEGDRRTPEGNYLIVSKHRSARFRWFLKINYPNAVDQANFALMRSDGDLPRGIGEGGSVGIHGTDLPILNVGNIDWTTGCISIDNEDISQLARLLPIGTLVVIKP